MKPPLPEGLMQRSLMFAGAWLLAAALSQPALAQTPSAAPIAVAVVADKLGFKPSPDAPRDLELGRSATGMLADPKKLAPVGATGFHDGARVTITCVGPGRMRLEVDEMDATEVRQFIVTLKVAEDGTMSKVPDRAPGKSK